MHNNNFLHTSRIYILQVNEVKITDKVTARLTVTHFERVMIKPFEFTLEEWKTNIERGYL